MEDSVIKKILKIFAFCLYIILFCFIAGEVGVRIFYTYFSNYNMEMWRYGALIKQEVDRESLPFFHAPNKEGDFYGATIKTNSLGLRDNEYPQQKNSDVQRIVILGDSFTLGWGVPFPDIYSKQLEQMLNKTGKRYEVINFGVGNYNNSMEKELFDWKGASLNPDMIILMHFVNDAEPTPRGHGRIGNFVRKHSYFLALLFDRYAKVKPLLVHDFHWQQYYKNLYSIDNQEALDKNTYAIRELISTSRENHAKFLLVSIPELHQLKEYPFPEVTAHVRGIAEKENVPFLDLLPALSVHSPETLWVSVEDTHANAKANKIIANELFHVITSDPSLQ